MDVFVYLFLAALGLCCCMQAFSSCSERGCSSLRCARFSLWWLHVLWSTGPSVVVVHGLNYPVACGIFLDQGSNPYPLHWQANS